MRRDGCSWYPLCRNPFAMESGLACFWADWNASVWTEMGEVGERGGRKRRKWLADVLSAAILFTAQYHPSLKSRFRVVHEQQKRRNRIAVDGIRRKRGMAEPNRVFFTLHLLLPSYIPFPDRLPYRGTGDHWREPEKRWLRLYVCTHLTNIFGNDLRILYLALCVLSGGVGLPPAEALFEMCVSVCSGLV